LVKKITLELRKIRTMEENDKQREFINERMREYAMNIDEFTIGEVVTHIDGRKCLITNKTINSIEVKLTRKTKEGVDCKQWFDMRSFNNTFKK